jgi:hypothetical protein
MGAHHDEVGAPVAGRAEDLVAHDPAADGHLEAC